MRLLLIAEDGTKTLQSLHKYIEMVRNDPNIDDIITVFEIARKNYSSSDLYNQLKDLFVDIDAMVDTLSDEDKNAFRSYINRVATGDFRAKAAIFGWLPGQPDDTTTTTDEWKEDHIQEVILSVVGEFDNSRRSDVSDRVLYALKDEYDVSMQRNLSKVIENTIEYLLKSGRLLRGKEGTIHLAR